MLKGVKAAKEIVVSIQDKVGALNEVAKAISASGANIEAVAGYGAGSEAKLIFLTSDNRKAIQALTAKGYKCIEEDALILDLENQPGALKDVTDKLCAAGVNIKLAYGTVCAGNCPARLIFAVADINKALGALKK